MPSAPASAQAVRKTILGPSSMWMAPEYSSTGWVRYSAPPPERQVAGMPRLTGLLASVEEQV